MPVTLNVTRVLYQFHELSDAAKEKARDWFRDGLDHIDYCHIYDDAEAIGKLMGIEISQRDYKTVGGKTRSEPKIFWSGFSSQGDGACFEGRYEGVENALAAVKGHAPEDKVLHEIADALDLAQKNNGHRLRANISHSGHYYHSGCTSIEVFDENGEEVASFHEKVVINAMRAFMDWIYAQLEAEYEYRHTDEAVDGDIEANQYTFTEDGRRLDADAI